METTKRILITGAAGAVGTQVCAALKTRNHFLRGFDRHATDKVDDMVVGDIRDRAALDKAMDGIDTVIHLAAITDDADFRSLILPYNIEAVYDVFEAAKQQNVTRVIFTSSIQAIGGYLGREEMYPIRLEDGAAPHNYYAVSKVFGELMGELYATQYGLSVIAVRLGWMLRDRTEYERMNATLSCQDIYLSHRDAGEFYRCAVEAENIRFATLVAVSRPLRQETIDRTQARDQIGFEAHDVFPHGLTFPLDET